MMTSTAVGIRASTPPDEEDSLMSPHPAAIVQFNLNHIHDFIQVDHKNIAAQPFEGETSAMAQSSDKSQNLNSLLQSSFDRRKVKDLLKSPMNQNQ